MSCSNSCAHYTVISKSHHKITCEYIVNICMFLPSESSILTQMWRKMKARITFCSKLDFSLLFSRISHFKQEFYFGSCTKKESLCFGCTKKKVFLLKWNFLFKCTPQFCLFIANFTYLFSKKIERGKSLS